MKNPSKIEQGRDFTIDRLKMSLARIRSKGNVADANFERAKAYFLSHRSEIVAMIRDDQEFWDSSLESIQRHGPKAGYSKKYRFGDIHLEALVIAGFDGRPDELRLDVVDSEWADNRKKLIESLEKEMEEDKSIDRERAQKDRSYLIQEFARHLGSKPLKELKVVRDFDPTKVRDALGRRIDWRIMELVRLVNMLGFDTSFSCQGHFRDDGSQSAPFINLVGKDLKNVFSFIMSLMEWERGLLSMGHADEKFSDIKLESRKGLTLEESQLMFDRLTERLRGIVEVQCPYEPTIPERIHRVRRNIHNAFPGAKAGSLADSIVSELEERVEFVPPERWLRALRGLIRVRLGFQDSQSEKRHHF